MTRPGRPNRVIMPTVTILAFGLGVGLLSASRAIGEVNLDPGDVPFPDPERFPREEDFHGIDFDIGGDSRRDWERRAGALGPTMTDEGIAFRVRAPDASKISIIGDFNDWDPLANPLEKGAQGIWKTTVPLEDGAWRYLFVVDGTGLTDPGNPVTRAAPQNRIAEFVPSEEGGANFDVSFLRVKHDELIVPRPAGYHDTRAHVTGTYDRVNQAALFGGLAYENFSELHPRLGFDLGYSVGRERWLYNVSVTQPIFGTGTLDLGVAAYRRNATPDIERVGDVENTLATLFFREDWRDYYEAEGFSATAGWNATLSQRLGARMRREDHRAVTKTTDWGLFGGGKRMRENPAMDEGELHALALTYDLDTRNDESNPTRGMLFGASYEWAGEEFGGDFRYRKGIVDVRRYQEISHGYFADLRVTGGHLTRGERTMETGTTDFALSHDVVTVDGWGAYPKQERFYLGGVGTMRATRYKSLAGDRMLLANAELRVEIFRDFQAAVFADVGDAWSSRNEDPEMHTDAGIGFQDSESSFRVNVAKKIDRNDDEIFVSARIRRMF